MLRGEWDAIRLEQPGVEKAEFVLRGPSIKSFHQAKRQSGEGKWTLAELSSKDNPYLQAITQQLEDANTRIVFVSGATRQNWPNSLPEHAIPYRSKNLVSSSSKARSIRPALRSCKGYGATVMRRRLAATSGESKYALSMKRVFGIRH